MVNQFIKFEIKDKSFFVEIFQPVVNDTVQSQDTNVNTVHISLLIMALRHTERLQIFQEVDVTSKPILISLPKGIRLSTRMSYKSNSESGRLTDDSYYDLNLIKTVVPPPNMLRNQSRVYDPMRLNSAL